MIIKKYVYLPRVLTPSFSGESFLNLSKHSWEVDVNGWGGDVIGSEGDVIGWGGDVIGWEGDVIGWGLGNKVTFKIKNIITSISNI